MGLVNSVSMLSAPDPVCYAGSITSCVDLMNHNIDVTYFLLWRRLRDIMLLIVYLTIHSSVHT